MNATELKEILRKQYGIKTEEEFNLAVEKSKGINIGIFTMPLSERREEQENETAVVA